MTLAESLQILNLNQSATIEDIKKAFRVQAKLMHPDKNKSPNANEDFIKVNEAYEFLIDWKTSPSSHDNSSNYNRADAEFRAREYARMRYRDFVKSQAFKSTSKYTDNQLQLYFLINTFLYGVIPFFLYAFLDLTGLSVAIGINLLAIPYSKWYFNEIAPGFKERVATTFSSLWGEGVIYKILAFVLNIVIYSNFAFRILLPFSALIISFIGLTFIPDLVLKRLKGPTVASLYSMVIIPLSLNLFVLSNFVFSGHERKETLSYYNKTDLSVSKGGRSNGRVATPIIEFTNGKYQDYLGMRFFWSRDESLQNNFVTITFKSSYCGLTIVTDYDFFYDPNYSRTQKSYH
ncbi:MAG: hypothetical protein RL664_1620 [Bacteroidota bacterium]